MMIDCSIEMGGFVSVIVVTLHERQSLILPRVMGFKPAAQIRLLPHELSADLAHIIHIRQAPSIY
jgi:hypothetical protein